MQGSHDSIFRDAASLKSLQQNREIKPGAAAGTALDPNFATHEGNQVRGDRQSQSGTAEEMWHESPTFFSRTRTENIRSTSSMTFDGRNSSADNSSLPASILEKSKMSFSTPNRSLAE